MARILCKYSGVLFHCEHMPLGLSANEYHHPLFAVPKKRLLALAKDWSANKLSPTESYLLYLSLLHSTELIIWRTAARFTERTPAVIAQNMEHLLQIIGKIDVIRHPHFVLPRFAVTPDTCDLSNSFYWIQAWVSNYREFMDDFLDAQKREEVKVKIDRREHSLEKLIKNPNATLAILADNLASWAKIAGDFPDYEVTHPITKKRVPISDLWEDVIIACAKEEVIWKYPIGVIDKLLEHCEENIPHGSIHAHALMKLLREGMRKRENYTGFGDIDLAGKTTTFRLLDANTSAEDANISAAIQSAPDEMPRPENYPKKWEYIKAKMNWELAQRYKASASASKEVQS